MTRQVRRIQNRYNSFGANSSVRTVKRTDLLQTFIKILNFQGRIISSPDESADPLVPKISLRVTEFSRKRPHFRFTFFETLYRKYNKLTARSTTRNSSVDAAHRKENTSGQAADQRKQPAIALGLKNETMMCWCVK